jgi:hypothetical protein
LGNNVLAKEVTILYTGDTHAALYPCHCPVESDGGLARRATLIKRIKKDNPDMLLLDAGGFFAGGATDEYSLNSELDKKRTQIALAAMDLIGYDAAAVSGEEFNFGLAFLEQAAQKNKFSFLSSNIAGSVFKPYIIKEAAGVKIGVIAVTEPAAQARAEGLKFRDLKTALSAQLTELRQRGAAITVVLSRLGEADDASLINSVPGIDLLISGYGRPEDAPNRIGSTFIASSAWQGRRLGKLTLKVVKQRIEEYRSEAIRLSDEINNDPQIAKILPACFSDRDCQKKGFLASCQRPATLQASCVFQEGRKLGLLVIISKASRYMDSAGVVNYLKQYLPGLTVSYLDYREKKAGELIKRLNIQALPAYILDKEAEEEKSFAGFRHYFTFTEGAYLGRPQFTGVTLYLNRRPAPGRIDLFFSLFEKESFQLLESVKDFKPELHFLAKETAKGFEAKNGRLEVEECLRALCVREYYPQFFWDYLSCRSSNADSSWWEDCLGNYRPEKISLCARNQEGRRFLKENIALGRELDVMLGPTYLLDNQEIFSTKGTPSKEQLRKILKR